MLPTASLPRLGIACGPPAAGRRSRVWREGVPRSLRVAPDGPAGPLALPHGGPPALPSGGPELTFLGQPPRGQPPAALAGAAFALRLRGVPEIASWIAWTWSRDASNSVISGSFFRAAS